MAKAYVQLNIDQIVVTLQAMREYESALNTALRYRRNNDERLEQERQHSLRIIKLLSDAYVKTKV